MRTRAGIVLVLVATLIGSLFIENASSELKPSPFSNGEKPIAGYILDNSDYFSDLVSTLKLKKLQIDIIKQVKDQELSALRNLYAQSQIIVRDDSLSLAEKRTKIEALGYNDQVLQITNSTKTKLETALSKDQFQELKTWMDRKWADDSIEHTNPSEKITTSIMPDGISVMSVTYNVFATYYNPTYSTWEVAVPDKYAKYAARGMWSSIPSSYRSLYPTTGTYKVDLRYQSSQTSGSASNVPTYEVGPWNENDNYWDPSNISSRTRRKFTDVPKGHPEAEYAKFYGYNGGKDEFGRLVTNPAGIDLVPRVKDALGWGKTGQQSGWVNVTYKW